MGFERDDLSSGSISRGRKVHEQDPGCRYPTPSVEELAEDTLLNDAQVL